MTLDRVELPIKESRLVRHNKRIAMRTITIGLITTITLTASSLAAVRPNFLVIMADDLGYGDLGCYGQARIKTPHIDRLAAEGMKFTQFYAGSTVCAPSRCVLMTGYHTGHCFIRGNGTETCQGVRC